MFKHSICEYKDRLNYGNSLYRGNTTGGIVADFLDFAHRDNNSLFVDPMQGGGTSADVARAKGIRYKGYDLRSGFNIVKDDLGKALREPAGTIFCHPPYWKMIKYSTHPDDLSNGTLEEFLSKLQLAMMNVYDALRPGGMYGVLMGNLRSEGTLYPLCSLTLTVCPGKLKEEIVKIQNNCLSDKKTYGGAGKSFVPIKHEMLYIFQKDYMTKVLLDFAANFSDFLTTVQHNTWSNIIKRIFQREERALSLQEVYQLVETGAASKTKKNPNWKAKVRQIIGQSRHFQRVGTGCYIFCQPLGNT